MNNIYNTLEEGFMFDIPKAIESISNMIGKISDSYTTSKTVQSETEMLKDRKNLQKVINNLRHSQTVNQLIKDPKKQTKDDKIDFLLTIVYLIIRADPEIEQMWRFQLFI